MEYYQIQKVIPSGGVYTSYNIPIKGEIWYITVEGYYYSNSIDTRFALMLFDRIKTKYTSPEGVRYWFHFDRHAPLTVYAFPRLEHNLHGIEVDNPILTVYSLNMSGNYFIFTIHYKRSK